MKTEPHALDPLAVAGPDTGARTSRGAARDCAARAAAPPLAESQKQSSLQARNAAQEAEAAWQRQEIKNAVSRVEGLKRTSTYRGCT